MRRLTRRLCGLLDAGLGWLSGCSSFLAGGDGSAGGRTEGPGTTPSPGSVGRGATTATGESPGGRERSSGADTDGWEPFAPTVEVYQTERSPAGRANACGQDLADVEMAPYGGTPEGDEPDADLVVTEPVTFQLYYSDCAFGVLASLYGDR